MAPIAAVFANSDRGCRASTAGTDRPGLGMFLAESAFGARGVEDMARSIGDFELYSTFSGFAERI
ncbi:hypothetical protein [Rubidibacter lacunae]|uniref:hypothetical protein n=1 Tax=Rubidibacter lacunae TaxID=582514 RepID=UPI00040697F6|nr:hypothetical protein [Rubidibacter lacunae]